MRTWSLPLLSQILRLALGALHILAAAASAAFKSRATLQLENLALRHQLGVLRRSVKRPKLTSADRLLWAWLCGAIHGELLKLGIDIGETSVGKYIVRSPKPPSQDWRTSLENHVKTMVSVDFFTVPTIRFQVLYVFLVLAHDRRRIVHFT
jgi:hypothetical protein